MDDLENIILILVRAHGDTEKGLNGNTSASIRARKDLNEAGRKIVQLRKKLLDVSKKKKQ